MCDVYLISSHKDDILNILRDEDIEKHFSVNINFLDLFEFNTHLGSALLDNPEHSLLNWDNAAFKVQLTLLQENEEKLTLKSNIHCRICNLPPWPHVCRTTFPSQEDSEKFLQVSGTVVRISAPKLLEYQREYICIKCKFPITAKAVFDKRNIIKKPKVCPNPEGCNGKNIVTFGGINRDNCKDYQEIKIQEDLSKVDTGNIPNTMCVALEDDLVNICKPGENVTICGIVKRTWSEFCIGKKIDVTLVLRANHVQVNSKSNTVVSPEDRVEFEDFWKKHEEPLLGRTLILKSICPEIYGLNLVKLAIALILAGGSQNDKSATGLDIRSEAHLLLVGDPGTGKSQMLQFASKMITRSVLTTGVGSSAAGLTVTALMEKGEWKLEAGALVMSDGGICCIDEFNSMKEHDRTTIHEAMEQQTISVAKAGIVCKLRTRCSILAACNPKGNLDPTEPLCMNIAMASPLLSRFDLVLLIKDSVNEEWDTELTDYILEGCMDISRDVPWSLEKLQSYFMIIKAINPKLTDDAELILSKYYQLQRNSSSRNKSRTTVRLLESLIRLSQGHARLMFHEDVEVIDAIFAIILADTSMDYESSLLNIRVNNCAFFDHPVDFYRDALIILLPKLELEHVLEKELQRLNIKYTQRDDFDPNNKSSNLGNDNISNNEENILQTESDNNCQPSEIQNGNNNTTVFLQTLHKNKSEQKLAKTNKDNKNLFADIDFDENFFNDFDNTLPKPISSKKSGNSLIENTQTKANKENEKNTQCQTKNKNSLTEDFKNRPSTSKGITSHSKEVKSDWDRPKILLNKPTVSHLSQQNIFSDTNHKFSDIHLDENIFNESDNRSKMSIFPKSNKDDFSSIRKARESSVDKNIPKTFRSSSKNILQESPATKCKENSEDSHTNINKCLQTQKDVEKFEKKSEENCEDNRTISKNCNNKDSSIENSNNTGSEYNKNKEVINKNIEQTDTPLYRSEKSLESQNISTDSYQNEKEKDIKKIEQQQAASELNKEVIKMNTEENNESVNKVSQGYKSLVSKSICRETYQNYKENEIFKKIERKYLFHQTTYSTKSIKANSVASTTNLDNKAQHKKRSSSPTIHKKNNIQEAKKAKKIDENIENQANELEMLKLMPSVNDDLFSFDLDWDNSSSNYEKELSQHCQSFDKNNEEKAAVPKHAFLRNFRSYAPFQISSKQATDKVSDGKNCASDKHVGGSSCDDKKLDVLQRNNYGSETVDKLAKHLDFEDDLMNIELDDETANCLTNIYLSQKSQK